MGGITTFSILHLNFIYLECFWVRFGKKLIKKKCSSSDW